MSDYGSDIDDMLLELAGEGDKKRKRKDGASKSHKRRKDINMDSDDERDSPESEDEDQELYPLEGKYTDERDRAKLIAMSEVDREALLAQRLEERQRLVDKRNLDQMLQDQSKGGADPDSVSKAAKRQHMAKGSTKEKVGKLAELKAKRKAKDDKTKRGSSPKQRNRSNSPGTDMEMSSDEEDEDGQISRLEQQQEADEEIMNSFKLLPHNPELEPATIDDLNRVRLTRDTLAKHCLSPIFEDLVKGAWVRYLIGHNKEKGEDVYRICEIINLGQDLVKPYKINNTTINQTIELKHGKAVKTFSMDKVSNSPFPQSEFDRLIKVYHTESEKFPTQLDMQKKAITMREMMSRPLGDADITAILARKSAMSSGSSNASVTMERSRLAQARTLAMRRQDHVEVAEIDMKLADLAAKSGGPREQQNSETADLLAKVNERNRLANKEAVRKAELMETERKKRDRKLAATGATAHLDPSARLRITPRVFNAATPSTRPGTPGTPAKDAVGTPALVVAAVKTTPSSLVLLDVEVDLGDF